MLHRRQTEKVGNSVLNIDNVLRLGTPNFYLCQQT